MFRVCVIFGLCGAVWCPWCRAQVTMVKDGRATAVILIADDASPVAFEAACELARVVEKATGATLLTFPEGELKRTDDELYPATRALKILVGDGKLVRELGVDVSKLPPEGFVIKTTGRYLILAGRDERHTDWLWRGHRQPTYARGTWHAVCAFLEGFMGVRWLWPGELGEVVPKATDVAVADIDRTDAPRLVTRALEAYRTYINAWRDAAMSLGVEFDELFPMQQEIIRWADHQRLGSSVSIAFSEFGAHWLREYGETHPEWFAMQPNGERFLATTGSRIRMCLSNPELIEEVVRRVVKHLDEHPDIDGFGIWPSDVTGSYCTCEQCEAWGPTLSDLVARHTAAVAEKVGAQRPGKLVSALAYHRYVTPPRSDVALGENVALFYVGVGGFGYLNEVVHGKCVEYWDAWSKVAQQIIWRPNNFASVAGAPRVYVTKLGEDFKHFYKRKMIGVDFDQLRNNFAMDGLNYYVAARLAWNPEAAVDEIVDDYCRSGFGAAGGAVRAYFAELERLSSEVAETLGKRLLADMDDPSERIDSSDLQAKGESNRLIPAYYPAERLAALRATLEEADALAGDDAAVRKRIAFLMEALDFVDVESALCRAVKRAKERRLTEEERKECRRLLARRMQLSRERCGSWAVDVAELLERGEWAEKQLFGTAK